MIPANNTGKDPVTGELFLEQTLTGVYIVGRVEGLEPGNHGFHVHAVGDLGNDCKNARNKWTGIYPLSINMVWFI